MFTSHGHHIPGTGRVGLPPLPVSKCGGIGRCGPCMHEALGAHRKVGEDKMAFTSHGYRIPGTTIASLQEPPPRLATCGGPKVCRICARETIAWYKGDPPGDIKLADISTHYSTPEEGVDFPAKAKHAVVAYYNHFLSDVDKINTDNVYVVWFNKTLQHWKALVCTTEPDGMYYEITFNGDKNEMYVDAYKKIDHVVMHPRE